MLGWRDIGLRRGGQGDEFSPAALSCPYCGGHSRFNRVFRGKAREEGGSELYSDVWQCLECANFLFVIWHASEGFFSYRAFPYEKLNPISDPSWPPQAASAYEKALGALLSEEWESAVVMAKHAIGAAIASCGDAGAMTLPQALTSLAAEGRISKTASQWAQEMPLLSSSVAVPGSAEAREVVHLCRHLLEQLFSLPAEAAHLHAENDLRGG